MVIFTVGVLKILLALSAAGVTPQAIARFSRSNHSAENIAFAIRRGLAQKKGK